MSFISLIPHAAAPHPSPWRVAARARRQETRLVLDYRIEGDLAHLRLPAPNEPRRADGLWRHTCCEAFLAVDGHTGYHELNFAPSTAWAFYRFAGYRAGMSAAAANPPPCVTPRVRPDRFELKVIAHLDGLPADAAWRLALATVIEAREGGLSYWALRHPPGPPDFHHPDSFTLRLESCAA
ncbi:MAG: DOMON-like domain-containing protein [Candidatus Competibacter sp.]|nr:DOMON-like domain-containing protein [Candidatus Competibacter sp.]MDG4583192.1 DOMON-like domain-containing protein [Candidatus Competibacter sp.]